MTTIKLNFEIHGLLLDNSAVVSTVHDNPVIQEVCLSILSAGCPKKSLIIILKSRHEMSPQSPPVSCRVQDLLTRSLSSRELWAKVDIMIATQC